MDPDPDPDPAIFVSDLQDVQYLMDPDADPGGPKTYGSYGSGFATLFCARVEVGFG